MIQLEGIEKRFGAQVLFSDLSWHIKPGERIGLVGPNGAGKTTLVRILAGQEQPDRGTVRGARRVTIGYLPQEVMELAGGSVLEETLGGQGEVAEMERRMHALAERLAAHPPGDEATRLTAEYGDLQEQFALAGGYDLETRAKTILTGLGFDPQRFDRPVAELSGGWRMRVALGRLLLQAPDLLLLDEPTNHLDLESLDWLEEFLRSRKGAFVVISHDRYFLNRMVSRIAELEATRLTLISGNYDRFVVEKERRFAAVEAAARNQAKERERMQRFVDRFRAQATKARQVQSRVKMLDRMEKIHAPVRRVESVRFEFPQPPRSGASVMQVEDLVKRYGETTVYDGVDFQLQRGDCVALLGPNGAGKTTMLKILAGVLPFDAGRRTLGHNVSVAYYAQHALDAMHPQNTVLGEMSEAAGIGMQPRLRGILGAFLFDAEEWDKPVSVLSGGEKARLALAKLLLRPANLMLLDEPTNHLDLRSREVLEAALAKYTGTLCFISHDRYFINRIATSVCEIEAGLPELHPGNYDEFRVWKARRQAAIAAAGDDRKTAATRVAAAGRPKRSDHRAASADGSETAGAAETRTAAAAGQTSARPGAKPQRRRSKDDRRREAEARQQISLLTRGLRARIESLEAKIAAEERKLRLVQYELSSPSTYENPQKAKGAARVQADLEATIATLTAEWEKATEEIESAEQRFRLNREAGEQGG